MTPDEVEAARVKNAESMSASRKHNRFVDLLLSIHAVMLLSSGESMSPDDIEAARVKNAALMSASRPFFKSKQKELLALIDTLGQPTMFATHSLPTRTAPIYIG